MAINPSNNGTIGDKITPPDQNYPYGSAKDETSPGAGDGTPYWKGRADEIFGFQQALLRSAGITPSGTADTAINSQYMQAVIELASGRAFTYDDTGAANAYVLTPKTNQQAPASYFDGMIVSFVAANASTGASTINVAGLGSKPITTAGGDPVGAGAIDGRTNLVFNSGLDRFEIVEGGGAGQAAGAIGRLIFVQGVTFLSTTFLNSTIVCQNNATEVYLPAVASSPENSKITIVNISAQQVTINVEQNSFTETITELQRINGGTGFLSAIDILPGDSITLASDGVDRWVCLNITRNNVRSTAAEVAAGTDNSGFLTPATANAIKSVGVSQTWQDITASRLLSVTYTNTTGRAIMLAIDAFTTAASQAEMAVNINGGGFMIFAANSNSSGGQHLAGTVIVPPGATYIVTVTANVTLESWWELR